MITPAGNRATVTAPELYQGENTSRHKISGGYRLHSADEFAFVVGRYDRRRALLIDPALSYSTLAELDTGDDSINAFAIDSAGAAYVLGFIPVTTLNSTPALYVAKLDPNGATLVYETRIVAGTGTNPQQIVVDKNFNVYVVGITDGLNFPTTNGAYSTTLACTNGCPEPFALKLDSAGNLAYSTFLVKPLPQSLDTARPIAYSIAADPAGALYLTGNVFKELSGGLPIQVPGLAITPGAFQTTRKNDSSAFVVKLHPDGSALDYSTYLGGSTSETPGGIAVDSTGVAYVVGGTSSTDFPTTSGAFQTTNAGTSAFFSKLKADGTALLYSTFLGASGIQSNGMAIAVDNNQAAYLTGITNGPGFPTTAGTFKTNVSASGSFNFVSKFDSSGNLAYSTYVGDGVQSFSTFTPPSRPPTSIGVDGAGSAYVFGATSSATYPSVGSLFPAPPPAETFLTKLDTAGSSLAYSTFLFPNTSTFGFALDATGNVYVAGLAFDALDATGSPDLIPGVPTTLGSFQPSPVVPPLSCDNFPNCFIRPGRIYAAKISSSLGAAVPIANPHQLIFSTILQKGQSSKPRTVTISNLGDADLTITGITLTGTNAGDFTLTNSGNCVSKLTSGRTCSFLATFTPTVDVGTRTASVNLSFGNGLPSQTLPLSAQAGFPIFQFGPNPVDFGTTGFPPSQPFDTAELSFTNAGTGPLHFLADPTIIGTNAGDFCFAGDAGGCGSVITTPIAPGATFRKNLRFIPKAAGTRTAQAVFQTDAAGSPQMINLTGNAVGGGPDFSIGAFNGANTVTVTAGQTATYQMSITAGSGFSATVTMSCSSLPQGTACNSNPVSITGPAIVNTPLTISTTAHSTTFLNPPPSAGPGLWCSVITLSGLLIFGYANRRKARILIALPALLLLGLLLSCGGGGGGGGSGGPGATPAGTYTVVVTGSANATGHSTNLTLIVK